MISWKFSDLNLTNSQKWFENLNEFWMYQIYGMMDIEVLLQMLKLHLKERRTSIIIQN
ncbi:uncharacterized protein MELLADRAFT_54880 [Melampsora larici-populina 98AG31]|uniref:Uncharacterized protein n=1 Tax=Melampsora larici-populina (strain 98AG31 / pathotype 3-4-7) TaxID=747676 RepID=F4R8A3_MELLP|nr:uncharacterized protein MELLADRAFT_54880 [Melampsora larici-populina 98AG31]EGG11647.1 hypothetical protein MELLADRAFT_54880 [Melampsora larici-populina 98AG31]